MLMILFLLIGPRFATLMWWLFSPERFSYTFSTNIYPTLGLLFLPWTTLAYIALYPGGFTTWDWILLSLSLLSDLASYRGGAHKFKQQSTVQPTI